MNKDTEGRYVFECEFWNVTVQPVQESASIIQAVTDPENQPSQYGTVTLDYHFAKLKEWEYRFEKLSDRALAQPAQEPTPGRNVYEDGDVFERIAVAKKPPLPVRPVQEPRRQIDELITALRLAAVQIAAAGHAGWGNTCSDAVKVIEALAQPEQVPVAHTVIAGALFDFMGYLTSCKERIVLSAADDAAPAVDAIRDFATKRGLSLDDAQVREWIDALAQPEMRPDEISTDELIYMSGRYDGMKQERALWELSKLGQEIEAQPEQEAIYGMNPDDWKDLTDAVKKVRDGRGIYLACRPADVFQEWFLALGTAKIKEKNT